MAKFSDKIIVKIQLFSTFCCWPKSSVHKKWRIWAFSKNRPKKRQIFGLFPWKKIAPKPSKNRPNGEIAPNLVTLNTNSILSCSVTRRFGQIFAQRGPKSSPKSSPRIFTTNRHFLTVLMQLGYCLGAQLNVLGEEIYKLCLQRSFSPKEIPKNFQKFQNFLHILIIFHKI